LEGKFRYQYLCQMSQKHLFNNPLHKMELLQQER
jgi:hypothetical protein